MSKLRLALVTRRFWPLVGGAEVVMANLAEQFREMDCQVTIVTAQWESFWPQEVVHREIPVVRLPQPHLKTWGTYRYMTHLGRWLKEHCGQLDAILVSMLKHSAYAVLRRLERTRIPVILRAEGAGETGDCVWQETARFGRRIRRRCQLAEAVVAPSHAIVDELLASGYQQDRVHFIANGVTFRDAERTSSDRRAARAALEDVNGDLVAPADAPVFLYTGRLHEKKGLLELVSAFQQVVAAIPAARLWIIGEGPLREELFQHIMDCDLRGKVLLPGAFDILDEVLAAADVFVLPSHEEGMSLSLLEAMAAELPVIATRIFGNEQLVEHDRNGLLVPVRDPPALANAMLELVCDPARAKRLASAASRFSRARYSSRRMAEDHLQLIHSLRSASGGR